MKSILGIVLLMLAGGISSGYISKASSNYTSRKYIAVNEEFCRILGYSRRELLRRGIKDCTHEDDYSIDQRLYEQLVVGKIPDLDSLLACAK